MKDLRKFDRYRFHIDVLDHMNQDPAHGGTFDIEINGKNYVVLATSNDGWEHVSVSTETAIPSPEIMSLIKEKFFEPNEFAVEFHPRREDYINNHNFCLHLWRPTAFSLPFPNIKEVMKQKPIITKKGVKNYDGKPFFATLSHTDDYEFITIRSGFSNRPSWQALCKVKQEYFGDEVAVTYHPPKSDPMYKFLKQNEDTAMIWRSLKEDIITPKTSLIGIKGKSHDDLKTLSNDEILDLEYAESENC